jgi:hypothetical protein
VRRAQNVNRMRLRAADASHEAHGRGVNTKTPQQLTATCNVLRTTVERCFSMGTVIARREARWTQVGLQVSKFHHWWSPFKCAAQVERVVFVEQPQGRLCVPS